MTAQIMPQMSRTNQNRWPQQLNRSSVAGETRPCMAIGSTGPACTTRWLRRNGQSSRIAIPLFRALESEIVEENCQNQDSQTSIY